VKIKTKASVIFSAIFFVLVAFVPNSAKADVTTGLVGWWRLDEGSGTTVYDSSGRGHTGTFVNSPTWVTGKVGGGALSFDGVSSFVRIPSSVDFDFHTNGEFSVSAWVYPSSTGARVSAVSRSMNNLWHCCTIEQSNATKFETEYVTRTVTGTPSSRGDGSNLGYGPNSWHHVVGVKTTDGVVHVYVDGVKGADSAPITNPDPDLSGLDITIGSRRSITPDSIWNGYIDDVRVYNRALSSSDIIELFNQSPSTPDPIPTDMVPPSAPIGINIAVIETFGQNLAASLPSISGQIQSLFSQLKNLLLELSN
jgi:hypothetical protein